VCEREGGMALVRSGTTARPVAWAWPPFRARFSFLPPRVCRVVGVVRDGATSVRARPPAGMDDQTTGWEFRGGSTKRPPLTEPRRFLGTSHPGKEGPTQHSPPLFQQKRRQPSNRSAFVSLSSARAVVPPLPGWLLFN